MGQLHAANACKWQGSCEKVIGWNGFTFEQRKPGWHGHVLLRMCPVPVTCPRTARQHGPRHNRRNFNRPWGDAFRVLHLINVSSYLSPYLLSYYHHAIIISSYISIYISAYHLYYIYIIRIFSAFRRFNSTQTLHLTTVFRLGGRGTCQSRRFAVLIQVSSKTLVITCRYCMLL